MSKLVSTNPAQNYEVIGEVDVSTEADVKAAVAAARSAEDMWGDMDVAERVGYFQKFRELLEERSDQLAELQTRETGKLLSESKDEVADGVSMLTWLAENAEQHLAPEKLDESDTQTTYMVKEPYGVMAVICPWNFPVTNFIIAIAQKMICGNVVVFKHSEECPLTAHELGKLMEEAGFPAGAFNQVFGDGSVGQLLVEQNIDFISFTGSSKVGKQLYKLAGEKFIKAQMELGGSSPGIIFADADLDKAIPNTCDERFLACGQVCCALKRLIVHESVAEQVLQKLKSRIETMTVGDPMNSDTDIGPLVAERQLTVLREQFDDAVKNGASTVCGGKEPSGLQGAYFEPTVLSNIASNMKVWREEVFGPILPVITFKTDEEAVELANDTPYGLSAFVYSADSERARKVADQIKTGLVSINGASYFSDHASFGGYKESGIGRGDGKYGFYESTQNKVIAVPKN